MNVSSPVMGITHQHACLARLIGSISTLSDLRRIGAYQNSLAKYPAPGPRLKNRRKICRRPGRLPKFSCEVPGARAAP